MVGRVDEYGREGNVKVGRVDEYAREGNVKVGRVDEYGREDEWMNMGKRKMLR